MQRRVLIFYVISLAVLLVVTPLALAEVNAIEMDFSKDFSSYARVVAELNQEREIFQVQSSGKSGRQATTSMQLFALLLKTDGSEFDFSTLSPSYIVAGPMNCFTLFFSSEELCLSAMSELQEVEGIVYAEPDCEVKSTGVQNEMYESQSRTFHSWGASAMCISEYIDYSERWGKGSTSIAVIDSGVFPHSLIQGKLLSSGYDYVDGDEDSTNDPFGHGTNVAGIIADCTNGEPVYIYPIRVLNGSGNGKMSNVVNAVREAKTKGVTIINLSLESSVMSEALDDAILEAVSSGIIVVVAAGNSSCNTSDVCPAHLTNSGVIVVGSAEGSDGSYNIASYSNYGTSVDVYAFGTGISCCNNSGGYSMETGTSMAAPHISSLCALIHIVHPGLLPGQVESRLKLASSGSRTIAVPDSTLMIPVTRGFFLSSVRIAMDEVIPLPFQAFPKTSDEVISYNSSDEHVVTVKDGVVRAKGLGSAVITASCKGFEDTTFLINVVDRIANTLALPDSLEVIDEEAFYGLSNINKLIVPTSVHIIGNNVFDACGDLWIIEIPDSVSQIGNNSFSDAVILCSQGSAIQLYAEEWKLQYIIFE